MTMSIAANREAVVGDAGRAQTDCGVVEAIDEAVNRTSVRKIRVLFVIDQLSVLGGGERAMIQMIQGLSQRFECSVVTFRANVHPDVYALLPVPLITLPVVKTWSLHGLLAAVTLRRYIRSRGIDIVHTFFETSDLFGSVVAWTAGVRAIISSRRDMGLLRSKKHALAYRIIGRLHSRVVTVSEAVRYEVLKRDWLRPSRVTTLYTGVMPPERCTPGALDELRERIGIPESSPIVLTVANILPWKGHHEFQQTASIVLERIPNVHFIVAGAANDDRLLRSLLKKRSESGMAHCFHYLGEVRPVAPLFQLASVFCLLSKTEGLPNVVLQAMAAGTPVVATRVGGTPELVSNGVTGFLVNVNSPVEAAARICQLLLSPNEAHDMAEAGKTRVTREFKLTNMLHSLEEIYVASIGRQCSK